MMYSDTITTLKSAGRRLTKLVKVDGEIVGYDEARTFTPDELDVASIGDLYEVLSEISADPYRCVVRGALVNCGATTPIRRLIHVDKDTGDRATLYEVPRFWVATDWDTLPRPDSVDLTDLAACASVALARLPVEFRGVSHIVSATSSHGIKDGIRIRLWHWLSRPLVLADLKIWLGGVSGIDGSVFRPAQVIYTAAPLFEGRHDPLPTRMTMVPGTFRVEVPPIEHPVLQPPPAPATYSKPAYSPSYAFNRLRNSAAMVASAGVGARHPTLLKEAAALSHLVAEGALTKSEVVETLVASARSAGKPDGEADALCKWMFANVR